ncbi:HypC/HybG/HupF family hydrogenase formation chaperone [Telmatospirillum siberiense]|uniref:HypC/HybG/HupF family hydrogenase formation chaperone n=1 Tax=Telmatospirillum siberiense TaxID=382514 RepID=A0A2N3PRU2_9PROT|nr:HypC/HybG/HupF family hydrogenase formation chaperone [Telmatospirillum siberiense]PKU23112.1 HypC/HybG/HupF family hydrogenase formation chaperone [Telmatospirillum siberiense]
MCTAIPSRVLSIDGDMARVECFGVERSVSLMLMNEPVAIGDFLTIQAGTFAVERVPEEFAREALAYFAQAIDDAETNTVLTPSS